MTLSISPLHLLHRAAQASDRIFAAAMGASDMTARQGIVLLTLALEEGVSQTAIVDRTGIDRSTMADIVRRLQRKGLIIRQRTPYDARAYELRLTEAGREAVRMIEPAEVIATERLFRRTTSEDRMVATEVLRRMGDQHLAPQLQFPPNLRMMRLGVK